MKRFLIIRLSAMGDVLLTSPAVRMLKKKYPDAAIDFLVKEAYAELLKKNPHIRNVLTLPSGAKTRDLIQLIRQVRREQYDAVIDWQTNWRSGMVRLFGGARQKSRVRMRRLARWVLVRFGVSLYRSTTPVPLRFLEALAPLGVNDDGQGLELFIDASASFDGVERLKSGAPLLILAPGASRNTKRWLPERFAEVGRHFIQKGWQVALTGGPEDRPICRQINDVLNPAALDFCGRTSLVQTGALLKRATLLITNDTGVMHMATALDVPLVAVFGPTSRPLGFYPFRARAHVVEDNLDCRPCSFHGTSQCPRGHFKCMQNISARTVVEAAERVLLDSFKEMS